MGRLGVCLRKRRRGGTGGLLVYMCACIIGYKSDLLDAFASRQVFFENEILFVAAQHHKAPSILFGHACQNLAILDWICAVESFTSPSADLAVEKSQILKDHYTL